jgi:acyl carrier protein
MSKSDKIVNKYLQQAVSKKDVKTFTDDALLKEDLSLDSLGLVSLFSNVINDLKISITDFEDTELMNVNSVSDLKNLFRSKVM